MADQKFRNEDRSDREILNGINDVADDGWATSEDIAREFGFTETRKGKRLAFRVASRMSWMRNFGFLERHPDGTPEWRITEIGHALRKGKLSRSLQSTLSKMEPGEKLMMMREISRIGIVEADQPVRDALRREYAYNYAKVRAQRRRRS